jgi:hypothetical protein
VGDFSTTRASKALALKRTRKCHLITEEFGLELKYREEILLQIMKLMREMEIDFAFPTRTLHVESMAQTAFQPS